MPMTIVLATTAPIVYAREYDEYERQRSQEVGDRAHGRHVDERQLEVLHHQRVHEDCRPQDEAEHEKEERVGDVVFLEYVGYQHSESQKEREIGNGQRDVECHVNISAGLNKSFAHTLRRTVNQIF